MTMEINAGANVWRECQIYNTVSSSTVLNLRLDTVRVTTCDAKKALFISLYFPFVLVNPIDIGGNFF